MTKHLVCAAVALAASALAQSPIPIPPFGSTFSSATATRGFYFQAPVPFVITGLEVPNEFGETVQNVEVFIMASAPPAFSGTASGGQVFYAANQPVATVIPTNIVVQAGDWVGVLGACGTTTMRNSYGTPAGTFASSILGNPVTLTRFLTQTNLNTSGGNQLYSSEAAGNISRIDVHIAPATGAFANFTATPTTGASPLLVQFTDTSFTSDPNGIATWEWDFENDGTFDSFVQNPSHTYTNCGTYSVTLRVTDTLTQTSTTTRNNLIVTDATTADFTYNIITPGIVQFTDTSTPAATAWSWDFENDGIPDDFTQNPVHVFANPNQLYRVKLEASRLCGPVSSKIQNVIPTTAIATLLTGGNGLSGSGAGNVFDVTILNPEGLNFTGLVQAPLAATTVPVGTPVTCTIWVTDAAGGYLANHTNAAVWRQVATGTGTYNGGTSGAPVPITMTLSNSFYLPQGSYSMAVHMTGCGVAYTTGNGTNQSYANADLSIQAGVGKSAPFNGSANNPRVWNGILFYEICSQTHGAAFGFYGAGCAGSLGIPRHTAPALPILGNAFNVNVSNMPQNVGIMILGLSNTVSPLGPLPIDLAILGMPGCKGRLSPDANAVVIGVGNTGTWSLNLPNNQVLACGRLFLQTVVLDPGINAFGAVMSDASCAVLGN